MYYTRMTLLISSFPPSSRAAAAASASQPMMSEFWPTETHREAIGVLQWMDR